MFPDVRVQNRPELLVLPVCYQTNYENLKPEGKNKQRVTITEQEMKPCCRATMLNCKYL